MLACSDASYDLIAFTETWLDAGTLSKQIFGDSYVVYREDRNELNSCKIRGGGVLLALRSSFNCCQLHPPDCSTVEQIWASITMTGYTLFICVIYIPPDKINEPAVIDAHLESLTWISSRMELSDKVIIIGDFNLAGITWKQSSSNYLFPDPTKSTLASNSIHLLDGYSTASLCQTNHVPNSNGRLLDLCYVTEDLLRDDAFQLSAAPAPLVKSCRHHPPLHISIRVPQACTYFDTADSTYYDFGRTDFTSMKNFLEGVDWDMVLAGRDANSAAKIFSDILSYAIDQFTPKRHKQPKIYPPWSNPHLKRLKSIKRSNLKKYSKYRTNIFKSNYITSNKQYKQLNEQLFSTYQQNIQQSLKENPKKFWSYIDDQRKENGLPSSMKLGDVETSTVAGICDLFQERFRSVFTDECLESHEVSKAASNVPSRLMCGNHPTVTTKMVELALCKLKSSSNPGPDGIPSIILKRCAVSLSSSLASIFNLSLRSGIFPSLWKQSYIFPVFKKGSRRDISNYRGIAALCATSKLFELIVLDFITHNCSNYVSETQHGFMPNRSTTTNLVSYTSFITRCMQKQLQVDAIYIDLSAAFDKINYKIAVAKLERLGFSGSFLSWLQSYLTGRSMSVKIGDTISTPFRVTSGVPQGSHLGPFIFLLYLNDVNLSLKCFKLSYADDFKLYYIIKDHNDTLFLQDQVDIFATWCSTNRMVLNASKCSSISFTRKHTTINYDYCISDQTLIRVTSVKDLGVIIDSKMTFRDHISYIVSKASKSLGFIFRAGKYFSDIYCLKSLYCALVRSTLEYAAVVWSPFYQNSIQRIEAIQRKFLRFALRNLPWTDPLNLPSYKDRCQLIHLNLLSTRRDLAKLLFVSDLIQSRIDCADILNHLNFDIHRRTLRSHPFFQLPVSRTNYGYHEPLSSMCRLFNEYCSSFDYNLSRSVLKTRFVSMLGV